MPRRDTPETPDGISVSNEQPVEPAKAQRYLRHDEYIMSDYGRIILSGCQEDNRQINEKVCRANVYSTSQTF